MWRYLKIAEREIWDGGIELRGREEKGEDRQIDSESATNLRKWTIA